MYIVKYSCPAVGDEGKHYFSMRVEEDLLILLVELEKRMIGYVSRDSLKGPIGENVSLNLPVQHAFLIEISPCTGLGGNASPRVKAVLNQMPRSQEMNTFEIRTHDDLLKLKKVLSDELANGKQNSPVMLLSDKAEKLQVNASQGARKLTSEILEKSQKPRAKL